MHKLEKHSRRSGSQTHPNFIIPGAAKSGTTYLAEVLAGHPEIFMAYPKEPHFFVTEKPYGDTVRTWEEYMKLFLPAAGSRAVGEASTGYLYHWRESSELIATFLPGCRILVLVRNPVDRAYSMYWHNVRDAREALTFEEALSVEPERICHRWEISYHYRALGYVAEGIRAYQRVLGEDRVKVILFDDLLSELEATLDEVMEFLDVSTTGYSVPRSPANRSGQPRWDSLQTAMNKPDPIKRALMAVTPRRLRRRLRARISTWNVRPAPPMANDTRRILLASYEDEIRALEKITERSLHNWRAG